MDFTASTQARPRVITFGSIEQIQDTLAVPDTPTAPPVQKEKSKELRIKTNTQAVAMHARTRSGTMMFGTVEAVSTTVTSPATATGRMSRSMTEYSESSSEASSSSPETTRWKSRFDFYDNDVGCLNFCSFELFFDCYVP